MPNMGRCINHRQLKIDNHPRNFDGNTKYVVEQTTSEAKYDSQTAMQGVTTASEAKYNSDAMCDSSQ